MNPSETQNKKSSKQRHTHRKRRSSRDNDKRRESPHAKVEDMLHPDPSTNTALVKQDRSSPRSDTSASGSDDTGGERHRPKARRQKHRSSGPQPPPFYAPTEEELRRYAYYVQLKERAEGIVPAQGHTYDGVKVSGNACVVQGNSFDSDRPEEQLLARNHKYLNFKATGNSFIYTGNTTHKGMALLFKEHRDNTRWNYKHQGEKKHGPNHN